MPQAALAMRGDPTRLRAAAHRYLHEGRNLTVAFLGSSITYGTGAGGGFGGMPYVS